MDNTDQGNSHTDRAATNENPREMTDGIAYVTIAFSLDGKKLLATEISGVKAFDLADCSTCPQVPLDNSDGFQVPIRRNGTLLLAATAKDPSVELQKTVVSVQCGVNKPVTIPGRRIQEKLPQAELARVMFEARVCGPKTGSRQHRPPMIQSATATLRAGSEKSGSLTTGAPKPQSHLVAAAVDGNRAFFSLQKGEEYGIDMQLEDGYSSCSLSTPFLYAVGEESEQLIPVYFEAAERVVALFCVGPDGKAAKIVDLQADSGRAASVANVNNDGCAILTGVEPGELKLKSSSFYLEPDRFHIDDRMAQSLVVHASPRKADAAKPEEEFEEIVLDLEKLLAEDEKAILRVLDAEGNLIDMIEAGRGQVKYKAKRNRSLLIQASMHGRCVAEVMHNPKLRAQV